MEESRNDVKMNYLRSMPKLVTSLKDEEEVRHLYSDLNHDGN